MIRLVNKKTGVIAVVDETTAQSLGIDWEEQALKAVSSEKPAKAPVKRSRAKKK